MNLSFSFLRTVTSVVIILTGLSETNTNSDPEPVTCEKLTAPMNGNVTYANSTKTDATTSGPYPIGTIATYMCEATYSIIGTNIRECNNSGQFNGSAPTCQRDIIFTLEGSTEYFTDNSEVRLDEIETSLLCTTSKQGCCTQPVGKFFYPNGSEVGFRDAGTYRTRDDGYVKLNVRNSSLVLAGRYTCEIPDYNGHLQNISIIIRGCPTLVNPANGWVMYSTVSIGGVATYFCSDGYSLSDQALSQRTCEMNGILDGMWNGSQPECQPITCTRLDVTGVGEISVMYSPAGSSNLDFGTTATYSCTPGFKLNGSQSRKCVGDGDSTLGMFDGSDPTCELITCEKLAAPMNGSIMYTNSMRENAITSGTIATYMCDATYSIVGRDTRDCSNGGEFSGSDPTCQRDIIFTLEGSTESLTNNSEVRLDEIETSLLCTTSEQDCCTPPVGRLFYPDGSEVGFHDLGTYRNRGDGYVRLNVRNSSLVLVGTYTCEIPDYHGNLQNISIIIRGCPVLNNPSHGWVMYSTVSIGGVATYFCSDGYSLSDQALSQRTCEMSGMWNGSQPMCQLQIPSQPTMVQSTPYMDSVILSWSSPSSSVVDRYNVRFSYRGECSLQNDAVTTQQITPDNNATMVTVPNLQEFSNYSFMITAINSVGGNTTSVNVTTLPAAPDGMVQDLIATEVNSTAITLEWDQVNCVNRNSRITGYNVTSLFVLTDHDSTTIVYDHELLGSSNMTFTLGGLVPRSNYTFSVSALGTVSMYNVEPGPNQTVIVETLVYTGAALVLGDEIYSNNSIITYSDIAESSHIGLFCITNYTNCCRAEDGSSGGQWYLPDSSHVMSQSSSGVYMVRSASKLVLRKKSGNVGPPDGIYLCEIPVNYGVQKRFYIGIYPTNTGAPIIDPELSLDHETSTLTCTSSGGPATTVVWTKDGQELKFGGSSFSQVQVVNNTINSTYLNILKASMTSDLVGMFSCRVVNDRGTSNTSSKLLGGVQIIGIGTKDITVGKAVTLVCVSDIPAKIIWEQNNIILAQGENIIQLNLTFIHVNDSIHGNTYTCRVVRPSSQSMVPTVTSTMVAVRVPQDAISTTILSTEMLPVAGNTYTLTCTVAKKVMGLSRSPDVQWLRSKQVSTVEDTVMTSTYNITKKIRFSPLKTSHAGSYLCTGNISSPAPPFAVIVNQTGNITLQIPPPIVILTKQFQQTLYAGASNQIFICQVSLNVNVDTDVNVEFSWVRTFFNESTNSYTHSIRLNGSLFKRMDTSVLEFSNLSSKDDKVSCTAILSPLNDTFLKASNEISKTQELSVVGVYLMFNSTILNETREIHINDIVPNSSLTVSCHSDKEDCCEGAQGQWKFPNGSVVPEENNSISVTRENGLLRLTPADNVTMPGGEYCCEAQDGRGINRTVCVKLQGEITSSSLGAGEVVGILIFLLFLLIILVIFITVLVRLRKQGKLTLPKLNYGKVRSKQRYKVTVDPSSSDFPLDDQNDSLTPSLNVYVGVTTFSEKETGTERKEDGEEDYFEDAQLLRIGHNSSFSVADFPGHVIRMHSDEDNLFDIEYTSISKDPQLPHNESVKSHNRSKNRFANVFPYDFNRVKLKVVSDGSGSDFINASYVNGYMSNNKYVAAQGPLPHTLDDFWQMIWENRLPTIVMVTKCFEDRKKCECYWPMKEGKTLKMDNDIIVSLMSIITFADFSVRKLRVICSLDPSSVPLEVTQFHYTAWPDHNVPSSGMSLIYFTRAVRKAHPRTEPKHLLVHCSAGVGRTGTFMVLDTMLEKMEKDGAINIYDCVTHIRKQRVLLVQTLSQYIFLHDALNELIACGETDIKAHNLRSVVDQLSVPAQDKATEGASVECQAGLTGFQKQFKVLEEFSQPDESVDYYTAQNEENEDKNRYTSIIPNEENRVRLQFSSSGSDYINASFVHGYQQRRAYIATQGPLEHTTGDFWSMVVENQCSCIVMLCTLMEGEKQSSRRYWPKFKDVTETYGDFVVTQQSIEAFGDYVVRKLEVSKQSSEAAAVMSEPSLVVTQFHFTRWKAKEYPHRSASLLDLIQDVNRVQMNTNNKPIVVICNNGIGRTGVFITLHAQLERLKIEGVIDVFQFIKSAREQREGLIDSAELYSFCHEALADYVDSFETYANFKELV